MIGVALALVATPLAGYALMRPAVSSLPRSERFAWSLVAGLIIEALLVLASIGARPGADFSLALSLLTALLLLPLLSRRAAEPVAARFERLSPAAGGLVALAAVGVALFAVAALSEPMWTTDYLAIWGLKAKMIFLTASVPGRLFHDPATVWSRPDYPLLVPLDLVALAGWARRWDDRALAWLYPLCQAATASAAFGFLARRGRALSGAVAAALIGWFFPLYGPVHVGMADIPLAFGFVLLCTALLDAFETDSAAPCARLAMASLFCAGTKPEGAVFAALGALLWIVTRPRGRAWAPPLLALLLPPAIHGVLLRWARGSVPVRDYDFALLAPSRWGEWLERIAATVARIASVELVGAAVALGALAAFFLLTPRGAADRLLPLLAAQAFSYVLACSLSAFGSAWLVSVSFGRIVCALAPALAVVLGARLVPRT
ncbi:MAG: hypothetical protein ACRD00_04915 [Thermoanaerobaculia bacterium]